MSKELDIKLILCPTKVVEVKTKTGEVIKLHLEGADTLQEHFIESVKYRPYENQAERDKAGAEYLRRLISSCVKKVEGVKVNGSPFEIQFLDSSKKEMDLKSYFLLNKIFESLNVDFSSEVLKFYSDTKNKLPDGVTVEVGEDKKKD